MIPQSFVKLCIFLDFLQTILPLLLPLSMLQKLFFSVEYFVHVETKNYANARRWCIRWGGKLFEPKSSQANTEVFKLVKAQGSDVLEYWIGINDISNEGNFVYASDSQSIGWTNWYAGEPNDSSDANDSDGEDCVHTIWADKWNDGSCNHKLSFVCEK